MDRLSYIRDLAFRYFNGKIPREAEEDLFGFILESPNHLSLFRGWEREWLHSGQADVSVEREWQILQVRLLANDAISPIIR